MVQAREMFSSGCRPRLKNALPKLYEGDSGTKNHVIIVTSWCLFFLHTKMQSRRFQILPV